VIEHARVGVCIFTRLLFEADAQLRFVVLARHPLVFISSSPFFGLPRVLFGSQSGRFFFLSLPRVSGDALALGRLALNTLFVLATNTVFLDAHELAKIEQK
jgi:hypothetical protein